MSNIDAQKNSNSPDSIEIEGNPYQIIATLGKGGYATIYKAKDGNGKTVAIKKYRPMGGLAKDTITRGFNTRRQYPSIEKNLLIFPENGEIPNTSVYNYVEGSTVGSDGDATHLIGEKIRKSRTLIAKVMPILTDMIEKGLVHRDIKPDNIQLSRSGRHATILDIDFLAEKDQLPAHTNIVMGTPYFFSPEQARGEYSRTMDIFSLGFSTVVSYIDEVIPLQLIGGNCNTYNAQEIARQRAYCKSTEQPEVQRRLLNIDRFPEEVQKDLHGLICFLIRALQPDPMARPKTWAETRHLLDSKPPVKSDHGLSAIIHQPNTKTFKMPSAKNTGSRVEIKLPIYT